MARKILMLLLPLLALVAGATGGDMLRPKPDPTPAEAAEGHGAPDHETAAASGLDAATTPQNPAWMGFANQFFVPVMRDGDMKSLMILTLTIETSEEALENLRKREHRLRDALLRQLMIQANTGAFDGNFTSEPYLRGLRETLLEAARAAGGEEITAVLIEDIARQ